MYLFVSGSMAASSASDSGLTAKDICQWFTEAEQKRRIMPVWMKVVVQKAQYGPGEWVHATWANLCELLREMKFDFDFVLAALKTHLQEMQALPPQQTNAPRKAAKTKQASQTNTSVQRVEIAVVSAEAPQLAAGQGAEPVSAVNPAAACDQDKNHLQPNSAAAGQFHSEKPEAIRCSYGSILSGGPLAQARDGKTRRRPRWDFALRLERFKEHLVRVTSTMQPVRMRDLYESFREQEGVSIEEQPSTAMKALLRTIFEDVKGIEYLLQSEAEPAPSFSPARTPDRKVIVAGKANVLGKSVYIYQNQIPKKYLCKEGRDDQANTSNTFDASSDEEQQKQEGNQNEPSTLALLKSADAEPVYHSSLSGAFDPALGSAVFGADLQYSLSLPHASDQTSGYFNSSISRNSGGAIQGCVFESESLMGGDSSKDSNDPVIRALLVSDQGLPPPVDVDSNHLGSSESSYITRNPPSSGLDALAAVAGFQIRTIPGFAESVENENTGRNSAVWGWDHSPAIDPILHDHPQNDGEAMDMDDNDAEEIRDAHNASGKMGDAGSEERGIKKTVEVQDNVPPRPELEHNEHAIGSQSSAKILQQTCCICEEKLDSTKCGSRTCPHCKSLACLKCSTITDNLSKAAKHFLGTEWQEPQHCLKCQTLDVHTSHMNGCVAMVQKATSISINRYKSQTKSEKQKSRNLCYHAGLLFADGLPCSGVKVTPEFRHTVIEMVRFEIENNLKPSVSPWDGEVNSFPSELVLEMAKIYSRFAKVGEEIGPLRPIDKLPIIIYVSSDLGNHPSAHLWSAELMEMATSSKAEVWVLCLADPKRLEELDIDTSLYRDAVKERYKHRFMELGKLSDKDIADTVNNEIRPNVVYVCGWHQEGVRLGALARIDGAVVVQAVAHASTTGSRKVDYVLCNSRVLPEENRKYFFEKPLYIDAPFLPNSFRHFFGRHSSRLNELRTDGAVRSE
jgi:hypothetical protein